MKSLTLLFLGLLFPLNLFGSFDEMLIGGRPALKGEFPEILYISSGGARCSAVLVSDQVIITAAHCVKDQGEIKPVSEKIIDFVHEQIVYTALCSQAPLYRDQIEDHDFALCKIDKHLNIKPASVSKKAPAIGSKVLLTGYGCLGGDNGGNKGNDGILRIGKAKVTKLPKGKNHWFYTKDSSALCFGDSGGPAMLSEKEKHKVIGINSRGDIKTISFLTALFTIESIEFMESFAQENQVDICGITKNC